MSEYDSRWDAIVIGSGLGGMATAAYLSAGGKKTLVLERHDVIGGSSQVFRRKKKWEFDCGVHYIGDCGPNGLVPTLLRGLGLDDRIAWLPLDPEAFDTIVGPDLELRVPVGWDRYLENLLAAFPREERGLRRYVATMKRLGAAFDRSRSPASHAAMRRYFSDAGLAGAWAMVPHAALLASCGLSARTFLALSVQSGALASIPQRIPTASQAAYLQDFVGGGAWYPRGGGQMLSAGFAEVVESHGGAIRTRSAWRSTSRGPRTRTTTRFRIGSRPRRCGHSTR